MPHHIEVSRSLSPHSLARRPASPRSREQGAGIGAGRGFFDSARAIIMRPVERGLAAQRVARRLLSVPVAMMMTSPSETKNRGGAQ